MSHFLVHFYFDKHYLLQITMIPLIFSSFFITYIFTYSIAKFSILANLYMLFLIIFKELEQISSISQLWNVKCLSKTSSPHLIAHTNPYSWIQVHHVQGMSVCMSIIKEIDLVMVELWQLSINYSQLSSIKPYPTIMSAYEVTIINILRIYCAWYN